MEDLAQALRPKEKGSDSKGCCGSLIPHTGLELSDGHALGQDAHKDKKTRLLALRSRGARSTE